MKYFYIVFVALCLAACGSDDSFTVIAKVDGLGTQNVRAVYRSADRVNVAPAMALDGSFKFSGNAPELVLIDIYTNSRARIGSLVARNGDNIEVSYKLNEPGFMTAKGNKISERMAAFITVNADAINSGDRTAVNSAIEKYAGGSDNDKAAAPYVFLTLYDPSLNPVMADSLLTMFGNDMSRQSDLLQAYRETLAAGRDTLSRMPVLRLFTVPGDSLTTVAADGTRGLLLAISSHDDSEPYDSVIVRLNAARDSLGKLVRVVELSTLTDTADWSNQLQDLTPRYTRCWMPGGITSPALHGITVPELPWYVAADTTARIVYSGNDFDKALSSLK